MTVTEFIKKFNSTQYRDNFSDYSLDALHQYLKETEFPLNDIPAICQAFREVRITDIQGHDVDFRDYCEASEPGEVEEFYEFVKPEFWPIFLRWLAEHTDDFSDVIFTSLAETASNSAHGIEVLKYIDDKQVLIDAGYFDDAGYYEAIAKWHMKNHPIIGSAPDYYDGETVLLTTND